MVHTVPRQLAGVSERFLQHLLCELIVVLELERFVVVTNGLVKLVAQMVNESQRKVCLGIGRVKTHALFQKLNRVIVVS